jgi:hypothetical protein
MKQGKDKRAKGEKETTNAVIARSVATKQSLTENALIVTDCFAALAMTARGNAMTAKGNAMMASIRHLRASAHFQLSTFNFQLIKRSKPKIRHQRVGII